MTTNFINNPDGRDLQNREKTPQTGDTRYVPTEAEKEILVTVGRDYQLGTQNNNKKHDELGGKTVAEAQREYFAMWNAQNPGNPSKDEDEAWKERAIRPLVQNKSIIFVSHAISQMLQPTIVAKKKGKADDEATFALNQTFEHVIDKSDYIKANINAAISLCYQPAVILEKGYRLVYRNQKIPKDDGTYDVKKVLDTVYSGHYHENIPLDEILIGNTREQDIQKQPFIFRTKAIHFNDAKMLFGNHRNFKYVNPEIRYTFASQEAQEVNQNDNKVLMVRYYNRFQDLDLVFINGIPVTDIDRPLQRKDKLYPFVKNVFETIPNFFYGRCLAQKIAPDNKILNSFYTDYINMVKLATRPPSAVFGRENVNSGIMIPGKVSLFKNKDSKLEVLQTGADLNAAQNALGMIESNIDGQSMDKLAGGSTVGENISARQATIAQQNSVIMMSGYYHNNKIFVEDLGKLILGDILQFDYVGMPNDLGELEYKTFTNDSKIIGGKKKNVIMRVSPLTKMAPEDLFIKKLKLMEEAANTDSIITEINPLEIQTIEYEARITSDSVSSQTKEIEKALNNEMYSLFMNNPTINMEALTREVLEGFKPGRSDEFMNKAPTASMNALQGANGIPTPTGTGTDKATAQVSGINLSAQAAGQDISTTRTGLMKI